MVLNAAWLATSSRQAAIADVGRPGRRPTDLSSSAVPERQEHQSDVLGRGVGKEPLEVAGDRRLEDPVDRGHRAEREEEQPPPGRARPAAGEGRPAARRTRPASPSPHSSPPRHGWGPPGGPAATTRAAGRCRPWSRTRPPAARTPPMPTSNPDRGRPSTSKSEPAGFDREDREPEQQEHEAQLGHGGVPQCGRLTSARSAVIGQDQDRRGDRHQLPHSRNETASAAAGTSCIAPRKTGKRCPGGPRRGRALGIADRVDRGHRAHRARDDHEEPAQRARRRARRRRGQGGRRSSTKPRHPARASAPVITPAAPSAADPTAGQPPSRVGGADRAPRAATAPARAARPAPARPRTAVTGRSPCAAPRRSRRLRRAARGPRGRHPPHPLPRRRHRRHRRTHRSCGRSPRPR